MDDKSFTVIELLVVIAIIGVLASIVLVSLSGTRDRAQITKTLLYSNQIYHSLGADIVGNWNFDEGSGTTALDSSGYYNTGTIYGGASYTSDTPQKAAGQGAGKYALSFDGTNDYVNCGSKSSLNITDSFTMELWAYPNLVTAVNPRILHKYDNANNNYQLYGKGASASSFGVKYTRNGVAYDNQANITFEWDKWYHVVAVLDNGIKFYINGALVSNTGGISAGINTDTNLFIGQQGPNGSYFKGMIDEVRLYNRALTASEIQQHYVEGLESHQNLAIK